MAKFTVESIAPTGEVIGRTEAGESIEGARHVALGVVKNFSKFSRLSVAIVSTETGGTVDPCDDILEEGLAYVRRMPSVADVGYW